MLKEEKLETITSKTWKKYKKCFRCGKPCQGYVCKDCRKIRGTPLSRLRRHKGG